MDIALFRMVNNFAGKSVVFDTLGIFAASGLIFVLAAFALVPIFLQRKNGLAFAVQSFLAASIGWAASELIGFLFFRPRPFVALADVAKLIDRGAWERSFPSGHATVAFAFAMSLFFYAHKARSSFLRALSYVALALAVLVAFGRVFVGVHYPLDVLGGAALGTLAAVTVFVIGKAVTLRKR
jgi:undecaprenyl-diphosphatase